MKKGFKKIVPDLIRANPGLTAKEYSKMAIDRGLSNSDSKDPVFSLATTLLKEVREGRMLGVKAIKSDGPLRFFIDNHTSGVPSANQDKPITLLMPNDVGEATDTLVEISKFGNRSEALIWLAREGIKAKHLELRQLREGVEQIRQLKRSMKAIVDPIVKETIERLDSKS